MGTRTTRAAHAQRPRHRASFVSVLGEILITFGVIALLYVSWQMWIGDWIIGAQKHAEAAETRQQWALSYVEPKPSETEDVTIPVLDEPGHGEIFGVMMIPRFGEDWNFNIAVGVTRPDILDQGEVGLYPGTAMPGAVGNTVYAAHRWTSGEPFGPIDKLVVGDAIVIETQDGWYTYRFRNMEYVQDTQVDVLEPVPQQVGVEANERYLTLTSCAPKYNMLERIIAYAVFESYTPRADGAPASLTDTGVTAGITAEGATS